MLGLLSVCWDLIATSFLPAIVAPGMSDTLPFAFFWRTLPLDFAITLQALIRGHEGSMCKKKVQWKVGSINRRK